MSDFSEMLSFSIKSRNINVNEMIQYCGIDRSTMYQIIRGKRKPANMRLVEEIAAFMELSPSERQRFIDTYEITRIGKEKFYSRKSVYQFLLDFDLLNSKDFLKLDTPPFIDVPFCDADSKSLICLSRQSQISAYIHRIFKQESSKEYGKIYIMLGINEIGYNFDLVVAEYEKMINRIQELQPSAKIIIQANMHVGHKREQADPIYSVDRINNLNGRIKQIADTKHLPYIDVNPIFDDKTGRLDSKYTTDSVHVLGKYYKVWADWLKTKAV